MLLLIHQILFLFDASVIAKSRLCSVEVLNSG